MPVESCASICFRILAIRGLCGNVSKRKGMELNNGWEEGGAGETLCTLSVSVEGCDRVGRKCLISFLQVVP